VFSKIDSAQDYLLCDPTLRLAYQTFLDDPLGEQTSTRCIE
jgi:hypothetical protein